MKPITRETTQPFVLLLGCLIGFASATFVFGYVTLLTGACKSGQAALHFLGIH